MLDCILFFKKNQKTEHRSLLLILYNSHQELHALISHRHRLDRIKNHLMHYLWAQTLPSRNTSHLQLYFPGNRTLKRITGYSQCCKSFWTCFFWHVARFSCIYARYLVSWRHAPPAAQIAKPDSSHKPSVLLKECSRWKKLTEESKRYTSTSHLLVISRKPSATPRFRVIPQISVIFTEEVFKCFMFLLQTS